MVVFNCIHFSTFYTRLFEWCVSKHYYFYIPFFVSFFLPPSHYCLVTSVEAVDGKSVWIKKICNSFALRSWRWSNIDQSCSHHEDSIPLCIEAQQQDIKESNVAHDTCTHCTDTENGISQKSCYLLNRVLKSNWKSKTITQSWYPLKMLPSK